MSFISSLVTALNTMAVMRYTTTAAPIAAHMGNNLFAVLTESFSDVIPETFYLMYYIFSFVITAAAVFCILRRKRGPNVI